MLRKPWVVVAGLVLCSGAQVLRAEDQQPVTDEAPASIAPAAPASADAQASAPAPQAAATTATETEKESAVEEPPRLSLDFKDTSLKDVLKAFSQQTGINVIAAAGVGDKPITVFLEDVTVLDALDQILRAGDLTYDRPVGSDIYLVRAKAAVEGPPTMTRVYHLKYARVSSSVLARAASKFNTITPFESARRAEQLGKISGGGGGASGGSSSSGGGGGIGVGGGGGTAKDEGIDQVMKGLLTEQGSLIVDPRTNSLIISDIAGNFPRIEAAIAAIDVRTPQVMVDTEIVETTLTKIKDLGVKWSTETEGDLLSLTPGTRSTRFPFNIFGDHVAPPVVGTPPTPFSVSSLNASAAKAILQALETDGDTKILARPKVLTLDNESAIIRLTSEQAIGFETTTGQATQTTTATPERTTTGVILSVTPQVNESGYVTMLVEPAVTKVVDAAITPPTNSGTVKDPKTRSTRSIVRVRSGDTLVVGGLIDRSESQSVRKVPILGDIPFVGEAFKRTEVNNSATELLAFLTPRILEEAPAKVAVTDAGVSMVREQEPLGARGDAIEQSLSKLEQVAK